MAVLQQAGKNLINVQVFTGFMEMFVYWCRVCLQISICILNEYRNTCTRLHRGQSELTPGSSAALQTVQIVLNHMGSNVERKSPQHALWTSPS